MVSLDKDFVALKFAVDKGKILFAALKAHRPRYIAVHHNRVRIRHKAVPVFGNLVHIAAPALEYIHRLIRAQR